jgi:hypothetical protein
MKDSAGYRVIERKKFAVIIAVMLCVVAVGVWFVLDLLAEYAERLEELAAVEPLDGAARLTQQVRTLAILNGIVLSSLSMLFIGHGLRGWRTASMPPKGSWILAGQRTWSGESAVRIAKFTIAVGVLLGMLAVVSSLILWALGDTLRDQTWKVSHSRVHEVDKPTPRGSAKGYWAGYDGAGMERQGFTGQNRASPISPSA